MPWSHALETYNYRVHLLIKELLRKRFLPCTVFLFYAFVKCTLLDNRLWLHYIIMKIKLVNTNNCRNKIQNVIILNNEEVFTCDPYSCCLLLTNFMEICIPWLLLQIPPALKMADSNSLLQSRLKCFGNGPAGLRW